VAILSRQLFSAPKSGGVNLLLVVYPSMLLYVYGPHFKVNFVHRFFYLFDKNIFLQIFCKNNSFSFLLFALSWLKVSIDLKAFFCPGTAGSRNENYDCFDTWMTLILSFFLFASYLATMTWWQRIIKTFTSSSIELCGI
jgi:hypothetical protein